MGDLNYLGSDSATANQPGYGQLNDMLNPQSPQQRGQMSPFAQYAMGRNPGLTMMLGQLGVKGLPSLSNPQGVQAPAAPSNAPQGGGLLSKVIGGAGKGSAGLPEAAGTGLANAAAGAGAAGAAGGGAALGF